MKKTILTILLIATTWSLFAQTIIHLAVRMDLVTTVTFIPVSCSVSPAPLTERVGTLKVQVNDFDVFQTASGQYYIEYINSRFLKSRKYLGYKFGGTQEYENNTIFFNAERTKCWIWTVDRYGQIYKMDLPDFLATPIVLKDTIQ
jgi:hypothetical protein